MKYLAILLCLCLLLSGCAPQADQEPQTTNLTEQITPDCELPPDTTAPDFPEPPTGTDSTAPAPEIGPEGLPTPAL